MQGQKGSKASKVAKTPGPACKVRKVGKRNQNGCAVSMESDEYHKLFHIFLLLLISFSSGYPGGFFIRRENKNAARLKKGPAQLQ